MGTLWWSHVSQQWRSQVGNSIGHGITAHEVDTHDDIGTHVHRTAGPHWAKAVHGLQTAPSRSAFGREMVRWSARNSSKGALLLESVKSLQFLAAGHVLA